MSKLNLEKGLDLALVRSRSRLGRENERLGLVSSRSRENVGRSRSRSRLGLKNVSVSHHKVSFTSLHILHVMHCMQTFRCRCGVCLKNICGDDHHHKPQPMRTLHKLYATSYALGITFETLELIMLMEVN